MQASDCGVGEEDTRDGAQSPVLRAMFVREHPQEQLIDLGYARCRVYSCQLGPLMRHGRHDIVPIRDYPFTLSDRQRRSIIKESVELAPLLSPRRILEKLPGESAKQSDVVVLGREHLHLSAGS